nr:dicarboxylate/amino acid:cation symporter [Lachnospiraceae bacterium]
MNVKKSFKADKASIGEIVGFVKESLEGCGLEGKDVTNGCLVAEEVSRIIIINSEEEMIHVHIKKRFGNTHMEISSKGEQFDLVDHVEAEQLLGKESSATAQDIIASILIRSMAESLKYRRAHGVNIISFTTTKVKHSFLIQTLGAMFLAMIVGFTLSKTGFTEFNGILTGYVLEPVKTMYMNGLKMVVAPVVFFSIVSCIVRFTDVKELGQVGGRILGLYLVTTVIAALVGIGVFDLIRPGGVLPTEVVSDAVKNITSQKVDVSIKDMIVNIVPANFVQPFVESNMLQLIFLAIVCGIAAGAIGRYSEMVKTFFEAINDLFLKLTSMFIRFLPVAIFCSICSMMMKMGIDTIKSIFGIFATFVVGLFCQMIMYCIIMMIVARISPIPFLKKYSQTMLQVFSMASSSASIPVNMDACRNLGVAQKIYSLSIPLGATLNMDGTCVYMAVFALSLAKIYGVQLTEASLAGMVFTIIVLSIGAPGIPGSGLIC